MSKKQTSKRLKAKSKSSAIPASVKSSFSGGQLEGSSLPFQEIEKVLDLMVDRGVAEFRWIHSGSEIHLRLKESATAFAVPGAATPGAHLPALAVAPMASTGPSTQLSQPKLGHSAGPTATASSHRKQVMSPFVGTFYRSPSPSTGPYINVGSTIRKGDVLCIIEAMKLMNEIESEISGRVSAILVENGQPVEYGEPLFEVEVE